MPKLNWVLRLQGYLAVLENEVQSVLASPEPRSRYDQERYAGAQVILDRIPAVRALLDSHPDHAELAARILDLALRQMLPELKMVIIHQSGAAKGGARQKGKHQAPSPRDTKMRNLAEKLPSDLTTTAKATIIRERLMPKRRGGQPLSVRQIRRIITPKK